jgi:hypothetical protein
MEGNVQNKNPALAGLIFSGVFCTLRLHSLDACQLFVEQLCCSRIIGLTDFQVLEVDLAKKSRLSIPWLDSIVNL